MVYPLILGSSSSYRASAMQSLGLVFEQVAPNIDETPLLNEAPRALVSRLALSKASHIAEGNPGALVIGSDQVGFCENRILVKPGSQPLAIESLKRSSGKEATFYTALATALKQQGQELVTSIDICATQLKFRELSDAQITSYVAYDRPFDAAGAFKAESLGIALFEYVRADDPSALIGLPLIALTQRLMEFGLNPLGNSNP